MLAELAEVSLSGRQLGRITAEIGEELRVERERRTEQFQAKTLQPQVANLPSVVVVEVDGGRFRSRAEDSGPGVHEPAWKEDKIAGLLSMQSTPQEQDPHPELPACFQDRAQVAALVRGLHAQAKASEPESEAEIPEPEPSAGEEVRPKAPRWQPQPLVRTTVATIQNSEEFAPMVAAEAKARNFFAASRQAFVGDGQAWNWTLQKRFFPRFVAIVDFIHVLSYIHAAAKACGGSEASIWARVLNWATACWQGRVETVIAEWEQNLEALGPGPPNQEWEASDPRKVLATSLSYLRNNRKRMDYPSYRRAGLPVSSSLVESLIKQFNYRVKGTEKFWNLKGAEAILQVRAALLSEDERLSKHMATRSVLPFRRYTHRPEKGQERKERKAG